MVYSIISLKPSPNPSALRQIILTFDRELAHPATYPYSWREDPLQAAGVQPVKRSPFQTDSKLTAAARSIPLQAAEIKGGFSEIIVERIKLKGSPGFC